MNERFGVEGHIKELIKEKKLLKRRLKAIETELAQFNINLKQYMVNNNNKTIFIDGLKVTYTKPREYDSIYDMKIAMQILEDIGRQDLIVKKKGYDRLTYSLDE